jgi:hypothetical protein
MMLTIQSGHFSKQYCVLLSFRNGNSILSLRVWNWIFKQLVCWCPATPAGLEHPFTYLPWKPRDPWILGTLHVRSYCGKPRTRTGKTPIYLVTFETSRLVAARNTSCTQLLRKLRDPDKQGTRFSVVTTEASRCGQARHTHLHSYHGNMKNVYSCVL